MDGWMERASDRARLLVGTVKIEGGGTRRPDLLTRESLSIKVAPSAETMTPLILTTLRYPESCCRVGGWVGGERRKIISALFVLLCARGEPLESRCAGAMICIANNSVADVASRRCLFADLWARTRVEVRPQKTDPRGA